MLIEFYRLITSSTLRNKLHLGEHLNNILFPVRRAFNLPLKFKLPRIKFNIHLVEHCNLNCSGCNHFSPLAEPEFLSIEEFRRDMKRAGELFSHKCEVIDLCGGEPLLHPDIIPFLKAARENFISGKILVVTNGILLPEQKDEFWKACHENKIDVIITKYPIKIDMEKIIFMAKKFDVVLGDFGTRNHFYVLPVDEAGKGDIYRNFLKCSWGGKECVQLSHGRFFTCTYAAYMHNFNKKFGKNIPVTSKDYINIYDDITGDEILKRLAYAIPLCKYCNIDAKRVIEWHRTNYDISEWT